MNPPDRSETIIQDPRDNGGPPPDSTRDFGATPVWVWNDGQVGGPFTFREVSALEAERGRVPGMLGRVSGGEWMPWPDLERWMAAEAAARPARSEAPDDPEARRRRHRTLVSVVLFGGLGLLAMWAMANSPDGPAGGMVLLLVIAGFAIYFLPLAVAQQRRHPQALAIGVLNIVAGWTLLGWIVALVWACTRTGKQT